MIQLDKTKTLFVIGAFTIYSFALPALRISIAGFTLPPPMVVIAILIFWSLKRKMSIEVLRYIAIYMLFIFLVIFSGFLNQQQDTFLFIVKLLLCLVAFFTAYNLFQLDFDKVELIIYLGFFSSLSLLLHIYFSYFVLGSSYLSGSLTLITEQGKNQIAAYLAVVTTLCFCISYLTSGVRNKLLIIIFTIHLVGLIYTFSRSALICSIISMLVFLAIRPGSFVVKARTFILYIFTFFALLLVVLPFVPETIFDSLVSNFTSVIEFKDVGESTSIEKRTEMIYTALELFQKSLFFGNGAMSFYNAAGVASHNTFLQILSEFGLLGGGVFFVLIIYSLLLAYKKNKYAFPALLCFFLTMFFQNIIDLMFLYVIAAFSFNRINGDQSASV